MRINVWRQVLGDSVDAVMSLSRKDWRKSWRFEFTGEVCYDAHWLIIGAWWLIIGARAVPIGRE